LTDFVLKLSIMTSVPEKLNHF